ncbi:hypothetical protein (mitochondrion) [Glycine soja]|uniref:Uncharacterized protein n=2 Tax=Glycine subgen. Soja TaxID=1462606 RepID=M1FPL0_SOYBN|nr:hypothetical protein I638_mgp014 [Glycine max]YP_009532872.1 hypothetical protein [Glycine soja]AFR34377.1 hypothetical protein GlmaxMp77 [Glycine max]AYD73020.1 hypothetical protein [Glycine soja]|eukprot:YP_007516926.1 hypothetical protein GlmaxMp77 (mitochondrion) [Glycine max]
MVRRFRPFSPHLPVFQQFLYSFLIIIPLLGMFYYLCLMQSSSETFYTLVWRLACSLSKEALSRLLLRGSSVTLIMAGGFALRAFFLATEGGLSMENSMMPHPHGAAESTHSDGFTYTSDMVPDSSSSGRSISSVEQPIPEEKPYIALLQLEGERKRVMEEILHIVEGQLEDPGLPRGPHEQALRFCWFELDINDNSSLTDLQDWRGSLRGGNLGQYQSIFGFYKPGGIYYPGNTPPGYKAH